MAKGQAIRISPKVMWCSEYARFFKCGVLNGKIKDFNANGGVHPNLVEFTAPHIYKQKIPKPHWFCYRIKNGILPIGQHEPWELTFLRKFAGCGGWEVHHPEKITSSSFSVRSPRSPGEKITVDKMMCAHESGVPYCLVQEEYGPKCQLAVRSENMKKYNECIMGRTGSTLPIIPSSARMGINQKWLIGIVAVIVFLILAKKV